MASDNHVKENDDNYDANSKDDENVEIGTGETLAMLDRSVNLKKLSKEEMKFMNFMATKFKLEKIRVLKKKQSHISDYFRLK